MESCKNESECKQSCNGFRRSVSEANRDKTKKRRERRKETGMGVGVCEGGERRGEERGGRDKNKAEDSVKNPARPDSPRFISQITH